MLVGGAMFAFLTKLLLIARSRLKSRASLEAENLVLRQQVIVLSRQSRSRVRLRNIDRLIFVWLYRFFPAILNAHRGEAPNGYPVASARLSGLLALEIAPTRRPPEDRPRDPRPHPTDEQGKPTVGRAAITRRAADARHRSRRINGG